MTIVCEALLMMSALGKHIQKHTRAPNIHANTYSQTHTHALRHTQHASERVRTNTYTHTHTYIDIVIRLYLYIV